jgi:predicted HAD superfamily phosphohydrolase
MRRLIKEEIVQPLDFFDIDHCVECIKGKIVKHIKKSGATRSSRVLEIIHTDTCGTFNVAMVDGYNSFITFTDDFSRYDYIYLIRE